MFELQEHLRKNLTLDTPASQIDLPGKMEYITYEGRKAPNYSWRGGYDRQVFFKYIPAGYQINCPSRPGWYLEPAYYGQR